MKALIDCDIVVYREAAKAERDGITDPVKAIDQACMEIQNWKGLASANELTVVLSHADRRNFRKVINSRYKAHRKKTEPPPLLDDVLNGIRDRFDCFCISGIEADDTLGILHTSCVYGDTTIVSTDKDMKTLPGRLINPMHLEYEQDISEHMADYTWFMQALCGDTADGFKGCPGIGPKKAEAALDVNLKCKDTYWQVALDLFRDSKDATEDYMEEALMNVRMARILRREDFDKEQNTIRLWHPEQPEAFSLDLMEYTGYWG